MGIVTVALVETFYSDGNKYIRLDPTRKKELNLINTVKRRNNMGILGKKKETKKKEAEAVFGNKAENTDRQDAIRQFTKLIDETIYNHKSRPDLVNVLHRLKALQKQTR